jgi:hypothetical protein
MDAADEVFHTIIRTREVALYERGDPISGHYRQGVPSYMVDSLALYDAAMPRIVGELRALVDTIGNMPGTCVGRVKSWQISYSARLVAVPPGSPEQKMLQRLELCADRWIECGRWTPRLTWAIFSGADGHGERVSCLRPIGELGELQFPPPTVENWQLGADRYILASNDGEVAAVIDSPVRKESTTARHVSIGAIGGLLC